MSQALDGDQRTQSSGSVSLTRGQRPGEGPDPWFSTWLTLPAKGQLATSEIKDTALRRIAAQNKSVWPQGPAVMRLRSPGQKPLPRNQSPGRRAQHTAGQAPISRLLNKLAGEAIPVLSSPRPGLGGEPGLEVWPDSPLGTPGSPAPAC